MSNLCILWINKRQINSADVLFVPEAGIFFVDGAVRKPGAYFIQHETTMQEAFLEAGGLAPYANKDEATLIRYTGNGERQMIKLDLSQPESLELEVKDRDIIIAAASSFGKLANGFRFTIFSPIDSPTIILLSISSICHSLNFSSASCAASWTSSL